MLKGTTELATHRIYGEERSKRNKVEEVEAPERCRLALGLSPCVRVSRSPHRSLFWLPLLLE